MRSARRSPRNAGSAKGRSKRGGTSSASSKGPSAVEAALVDKLISGGSSSSKGSRAGGGGSNNTDMLAPRFSAGLSRKVLSSLEILNASLNDVRSTVARIDSLAASQTSILDGTMRTRSGAAGGGSSSSSSNSNNNADKPLFDPIAPLQLSSLLAAAAEASAASTSVSNNGSSSTTSSGAAPPPLPPPTSSTRIESTPGGTGTASGGGSGSGSGSGSGQGQEQDGRAEDAGGAGVSKEAHDEEIAKLSAEVENAQLERKRVAALLHRLVSSEAVRWRALEADEALDHVRSSLGMSEGEFTAIVQDQTEAERRTVLEEQRKAADAAAQAARAEAEAEADAALALAHAEAEAAKEAAEKARAEAAEAHAEAAAQAQAAEEANAAAAAAAATATAAAATAAATQIADTAEDAAAATATAAAVQPPVAVTDEPSVYEAGETDSVASIVEGDDEDAIAAAASAYAETLLSQYAAAEAADLARAATGADADAATAAAADPEALAEGEDGVEEEDEDFSGTTVTVEEFEGLLHGTAPASVDLAVYGMVAPRPPHAMTEYLKQRKPTTVPVDDDNTTAAGAGAGAGAGAAAEATGNGTTQQAAGEATRAAEDVYSGVGGAEDAEDDMGLDADLAAAALEDGDGDGDAIKPASKSQFTDFKLRVVYEPNKTGFEQTKDFHAKIGSIIAGRYKVRDYLGSAAFSSAYSCWDYEEQRDVCLKVVKNNKHYMDQSLDEIKLLLFLNDKSDCDRHHVLKMFDFFYHKEHLIIVTELLKDNLYEFQKYLYDAQLEPYFTVPRLQRIARQCLHALHYIHSQNVIHCDLKPENILIQSYSRCDVKIIDFGSSCFTTDQLTNYIQSRSYRAPEVVLDYAVDTKIDIWSLGCILSELYTGDVLFQNDSVQTMLARMVGVKGGFPEDMLKRGRDVAKYLTPDRVIYEYNKEDNSVYLFKPKPSSMRRKLQDAHPLFADFVDWLLVLDPAKRPSAEEALLHPFFNHPFEFEPYVLPA